MAGPHHGLCSQSLPSCPGLLLGSLQLLAQGCPADMDVSLVGPRVGDSLCSLGTAALCTVPGKAATHTRISRACCPALYCSSIHFTSPCSCGVHKADWMRLQALGPLHCPTPTLVWEKPGQAPGLGGCTLTPFPSFCRSVSGVRKSLGCACTEEWVPASLYPCCTPTWLPPSQTLHVLMVT